MSRSSEMPTSTWSGTCIDQSYRDSSVWKGRWSGRQIAVKYFPSITDKDAFVTQVERWMAIKHECILPVFGGSSGTGPRPWYVVGPYSESEVSLYCDGRCPQRHRANDLHSQ